MAGGEDWRGRAGGVALADAVVLAREGRPDEAERAFARRPARCCARTGSRATRPTRLHQWGRLLDVPERLDEAEERYRACGAGALWLDRVAADRRRLR